MIKEFVKGIKYYKDALGLVRRYGLLNYFLFSGLLGLVVLFTLIFAVSRFDGNLRDLLLGWLPWEHSILSGVGSFISTALLAIIGFVIYKYLILIVTAPLMSKLSEKLESSLSGTPDTTSVSFARGLVRGLIISIRNIVREVGLTIILFLLGLIPLLGFFTPILIFAVQAYYAGFGNFDYWAERHFNYRNTLRFMKFHRPALIANGTIFVILLTIPVIGVFIAPPLATIASTLHGEKILDHDSDSV